MNLILWNRILTSRLRPKLLIGKMSELSDILVEKSAYERSPTEFTMLQGEPKSCQNSFFLRKNKEYSVNVSHSQREQELMMRLTRAMKPIMERRKMIGDLKLARAETSAQVVVQLKIEMIFDNNHFRY